MEGIIENVLFFVLLILGTFRYLNGKTFGSRISLLIASGAMVVFSLLLLIKINDHEEPFYMPKNAKYMTADIINKVGAPHASYSEMRHNGLTKIGKLVHRSTSYFRLDITYKYSVNGKEYVKQGSVRGKTYDDLADYGDTVKIVYNAENPSDVGVVGEEGQIIRINYYLNYALLGYEFLFFIIILAVQPKNKKGN